MSVIKQRGYGDPREVLHLTEREVPTFGADQVLVRVHASSANPYDWHLIYGEPTLMRPQLGGIRAPRRRHQGEPAGDRRPMAAAMPDEVAGLAAQTGRSPEELSADLAAILPGLVDTLSPNGQVPSDPADVEAVRSQIPGGAQLKDLLGPVG